MPLAKVLKEVTHREYLLWMQWLEIDRNRVTPDQYYLMQIAQEVRRVLSKNKSKILLKHFRIKFGRKKDKENRQPTREELNEATRKSRAGWFARVGLKGSKDYG